MTQPTNLYSSYDVAAAGGNREDLMNDIFNVAPMKTPLLSKLQRTKAKARKHEWVTDTLDTPSATNYFAEGSDFSASAVVAPVRLYNICQISKKEFAVSGTQEVTDKAGRTSEITYVYGNKSQELKTDMETQIFANNAAVDTNESTARELGGLEAWYVSNVSRGSGGSSGSVGTTAATDGTQRAFTESMYLAVRQSMFANSGDSENAELYVGPFNRRVFSTFSFNASPTVNAAGKQRVSTVEVAIDDFGEVKIYTSRHCRTRTAHIVVPELLGLSTLRPVERITYAKDGDNHKHGLLVEYTLECRNEKGLGVVADLTTS